MRSRTALFALALASVAVVVAPAVLADDVSDPGQQVEEGGYTLNVNKSPTEYVDIGYLASVEDGVGLYFADVLRIGLEWNASRGCYEGTGRYEGWSMFFYSTEGAVDPDGDPLPYDYTFRLFDPAGNLVWYGNLDEL